MCMEILLGKYLTWLSLHTPPWGLATIVVTLKYLITVTLDDSQVSDDDHARAMHQSLETYKVKFGFGES